MYGGVGLKRARGSGTSGHIQKGLTYTTVEDARSKKQFVYDAKPVNEDAIQAKKKRMALLASMKPKNVSSKGLKRLDDAPRPYRDSYSSQQHPRDSSGRDRPRDTQRDRDNMPPRKGGYRDEPKRGGGGYRQYDDRRDSRDDHDRQGGYRRSESPSHERDRSRAASDW